MKFCVLCIFALLVEIGSISSFQSSTQTKRDPRSAPPSAPSVDYPEDVGILIRNSDWTEIPNVLPSKTKTKHGVVHSLTYGAVPASVVATYDGAHSEVQIQPSRPIICICHMPLPRAPVIVKLHPKKDSRELDGGRLPVIGAKLAEATENDLIPAEVSQPESTVWLVRPVEAIPPGEYALMLGTQNISIFPFTVVASDRPAPPPSKH
jgi:hypothetical protein